MARQHDGYGMQPREVSSREALKGVGFGPSLTPPQPSGEDLPPQSHQWLSQPLSDEAKAAMEAYRQDREKNAFKDDVESIQSALTSSGKPPWGAPKGTQLGWTASSAGASKPKVVNLAVPLLRTYTIAEAVQAGLLDGTGRWQQRVYERLMGGVSGLLPKGQS